MSRDWVSWHDGYDDPASRLSSRLALVQRRLSEALTAAPRGPVNLVSLCAGQGRDVLGVLPRHRRRADVRAVLFELDPYNAALTGAGMTSVGVHRMPADVQARSRTARLPAERLFTFTFRETGDLRTPPTAPQHG